MPRRTRDAAIVLLVLTNVVLLCTALTWIVHLPQARAQTPAPIQQTGANQYLAISGQVQSGIDAQYLLDINQQRLYVLSPSRVGGSNTTMQVTDVRDLRADFASPTAPAIPPRGRR